ncbi:hypothetical protein [Aquimarina sp. RZ0]|uniref:hypothetical protein n=1 Tax=Aquimarina sp. RZ0 TaxID=2607730 RepID=UPI00165FBA95|nr:hypothetical protein [Aquimarina sp. RZ0]
MGLQSKFLLTNTENSNTYGIGINGRYFFMPKRRFNVFTELALDYSNTEINFRSYKGKTDAYSATFSTGLNYFITKHLSLFTKFEILDYCYYKTDANRNFTSQQQQQNFDDHKIRIGPENLHLGIMYNFKQMRTSILCFLAVLWYSNIVAQSETQYGFEKGDFTIYGTMNYSYQNSESFRNNIEGGII